MYVGTDSQCTRCVECEHITHANRTSERIEGRVELGDAWTGLAVALVATANTTAWRATARRCTTRLACCEMSLTQAYVGTSTTPCLYAWRLVLSHGLLYTNISWLTDLDSHSMTTRTLSGVTCLSSQRVTSRMRQP